MNPKLSIILPTYNGDKYIRKAIESIISQSFSDWELIVVDDGSTDNTENIVKKYADKDNRIIYFKNDFNLGIQRSLNKGIQESKGEYIARIDDDDEWIDKNKLKKQFEFLDNNKEYVLVGTGAVNVDEEGEELFRYLGPKTDEEIRRRILRKNCFLHSSVIFRREVVLMLGMYSEDNETRHIEDYDLWLKLGLVGKFANLSIYGVRILISVGSISFQNRMEQFRKNLTLIQKYKGKYPNYFKSVVFNYLRIYLYKLFELLPCSFKNKIFKIYKEF